MTDNQSLLNQLQQLLSWKKSKKFYAEKLGITENEVNDLLIELRNRENINTEAEIANYIDELEQSVIKYQEDVLKGTGEVIFNSLEEIRSLDELIEKCKIDTEKWEISKYVQNYWGNAKQPHWQVKAWLNKRSTEKEFQDSFVEFLKTYKPVSPEIMLPKFEEEKGEGALIINKQDAHYNKADIDGRDSIQYRFGQFLNRLEVILNQAELSSDLEEIFYIVGSDEFNSEFTGTTTKGTPQQNTMSYHESFMNICEHEVEVISLLLQKARNVTVIYVPGNHDEYVGWHLITWLQTYFRYEGRVGFDTERSYRKYVSFGTSAIMFNHGDAMKPAKLAGVFPIEYKNEWSQHDNFYIFTGDKHHELSQDFNGIKFYQIPALSNAKSSWDEKNGYTCSRAELTAFLIDSEEGMINMFKQYL